MSRLIIKNLPKKITEDKIRELFGVIGTVTDVQLKYTEEGKFRQFAFIGYHTENEANEAIKQFNNTHIKTHRIQVEACSSLGDATKPKSWSKYASDSNAFKRNTEGHAIKETDVPETSTNTRKKKELELLEKYKDDPKFEEFLELHAPNDKGLLLETKNVEEPESGDDQRKTANQQVSDVDYMKSLIRTEPPPEKKRRNLPLYTIKLQNVPIHCKKKDIKDFFRTIAPFSIRLPRKIKGICFATFKTEKKFKRALLKDKSFINGKQVSVTAYKLPQSEASATSNTKRSKWKSQEDALKDEEDVAESGRIFIRNLSYTCTEDVIQELFAKYGPITEVNLPIDSVTRKLKGFGFVTFLMPEHAVKAYTELDGSIVQGRMLHLLPGKAKADETDSKVDESTNYKQKKIAKLKSQAGSSYNWNSLFLGHNAVADVIAKTYGTSKEAVLNPHGDSNAAVRLALGETQIVASTRKYLEAEGVHLDAFNNAPTKRSKTVILVKNLPAETELAELRELFQKYGVIGRIIFPPSGITAIVEFLEPSEARKAFMGLAYSKFKHTPLYLEWAPADGLKSLGAASDTVTVDAKVEETPEVKLEEEIEEEPEPDTTLFVKNLNFRTTDAGLRQHFAPCGKIHYANVAMKKDNRNPSLQLSMGYGFVRFIHKASANKALKELQNSTLDDKILEIKRSERTLANEAGSTRKSSKVTKQTGTKILVRNVPFQAKHKELFELFSTFGEIKALRLPKKISTGEGGDHRGFAFVDFFTNANAKSAFEALGQSTHLFGRRLVLEWASQEDEEVDAIRKRTAEHFQEEKEVRSKKSVFNIES
ncbi:hypothetical protein PPYR_14696 [Photinus pyralis]|uniref:RRM domain-containing protein n=1 Tax=Photinus pyralis TaxID=7054 RepID=A0A5N4A5Z4_PHOPY|nr:probable RNA-binding protein 19 [Photinus pyralis]KAB0792737.1 hypothetical protein PPYR_14696 [Photinus pyralis]